MCQYANVVKKGLYQAKGNCAKEIKGNDFLTFNLVDCMLYQLLCFFRILFPVAICTSTTDLEKCHIVLLLFSSGARYRSFNIKDVSSMASKAFVRKHFYFDSSIRWSAEWGLRAEKSIEYLPFILLSQIEALNNARQVADLGDHKRSHISYGIIRDSVQQPAYTATCFNGTACPINPTI